MQFSLYQLDFLQFFAFSDFSGQIEAMGQWGCAFNVTMDRSKSHRKAIDRGSKLSVFTHFWFFSESAISGSIRRWDYGGVG